jgi:phosphatidylglycerophosphatase A
LNDGPRLDVRSLSQPTVLLATGCGVGLVPVAPGTVGSLAALPLWWWLLADLPLLAAVGVLVALALLGVWIIDRACRKTGVGDAGAIVLDELVGQWIALLAAPKTLLGVAAAFVLFRLFDIAKPWPVSWADRSLDGGLGIMLDDVLAGVMAGTVVWLAVVGFGEALFAWPQVSSVAP